MNNDSNRLSIIASNGLSGVIKSYGIELVKKGADLVCKCPFHSDKNPSLRVNENKSVWYCDPCGVGGSVIDFVSKFEGISIAAAMNKLSGLEQKTITTAVNSTPKILTRYDYLDANGNLRFQVCRLEPKSFRQRHKSADGLSWVWNMDGIERVLYHLPEILSSDEIYVCEGEKDADTLCAFGYTGTTNVGGAKKWMDGYSDCLSGKRVYVIADNDKAGQEHAVQVCRSLVGKSAKTFRVTIPSQFKDVTDWIMSFSDQAQAAEALSSAISGAKIFCPHEELGIQSLEELELEYKSEVISSDTNSLSLHRWLPSLRHDIRPIRAGETVVIMADTGRGKSLVLQHIAIHANPLPVLFFEIELTGSLMFERFVQMSERKTSRELEANYKTGQVNAWGGKLPMNHIFVCAKSRMTVKLIEETINKAELKMGVKPAVVIVDYIGLVSSEESGASRYERISNVAEQLKVMAKSTGTIIVMATQVHRKMGDDKTYIPDLHSAKDSGSVENSAGLVLGVWREGDSGEQMKIKILKNTKGMSGKIVDCVFEGQFLSIREQYTAGNESVNRGDWNDKSES